MQIYIHGFHSIEESLKQAGSTSILFIAKEKGRVLHLTELARRLNVPVRKVGPEVLDKYCDPDKHRGALLCLEAKNEDESSGLIDAIDAIKGDTALVVALDSITDPHNFGAILRSADQFACDFVVTTERRSARDTETVASTSSGANAYVKQVVVPNLTSSLKILKDRGLWVYGAEMSGADINKADFRGKVVLVLGSEGRGIHRLIKEHCDVLVRIPASGKVDSFNVSVAAGIFMYEIRRQQKFFNK
jgi:23S rRNA (guanosine2251-2'-O)-methyltransferase